MVSTRRVTRLVWWRNQSGKRAAPVVTVRPAVDISSLEEVLVVLVPHAGDRRNRTEPVRPAADRRSEGGRCSAALSLAWCFRRTLGGVSLDAGTRVNFVLVAVIYCALSFGAMTGLLPDSPAGWPRTLLRAASSVSAAFRRRWWASLSACSGHSSSSPSRSRASSCSWGLGRARVLFSGADRGGRDRAACGSRTRRFSRRLPSMGWSDPAFQIVERPGLMQRRDARRASFGSRRQF